MALVAVKPSGTPLKWFILSFLAVLVNLGGGAALPLSSQFKVYGLDTVRAGQAAFLNCHLEGSDMGAVTRPPSYVWVKDGKVIPGQTDMFLRFKGVTREDAGLYQCGAPGSDVGGEGRHLHVVVPGDILPRPIIDFRDHPVCGRPYSLGCLFLERYIPSVDTVYTWYKDHTEVKGQSGQTLSFPNVTEADRGEYVCTGREGGWETTSPISQEFHMQPLVIPQVTVETPSTDSVAKGILGQKLTLTARVIRASPQVPRDGYSWSFFPSPEGQLRPLAEKSNTLTLGPLTWEDRGQYFCQARNDQGNRDLRLIGHASVTVDIVYLKGIKLTPNLEVNEGDPVAFTCGVDSHPTARLAWTVDGQEVRHVTYNVDHYVIPSAACSDSNNYTCGASNPDLPGLEIHATVQLTVLCRQAATEAPTTVPPITTTDFTPELADTNSGTWTMIAIVPTAILGIIIVTVAVLVLLWHRLTNAQRRKFLTKVFDYFCPAQAEGTEFRSSMEGQTVVELESLSFQESTTSDEFSHLLGDVEGADRVSITSSEGNELRRRRGNKGEGAAANTAKALDNMATGANRTSLAIQKSKSDRRRAGPTPQVWLQKNNIQFLVGKTKTEYQAWLQALTTMRRPALWGIGGQGDSNHAFRTAVSKYLCMTSYGDGDDPLRWLATPEQASVHHCTDKLLHVWGPPGSGKTLLLLDRVRRWLLRGKTVVLAVCGPSYELLLYHIGRAAVKKLTKCTANRLTLSSNLEEIGKTIDTQREKIQAASVCVAVDAIEADFHNVLMDTCRSSTVECVWTTSRADIPNLGEFQKLEGRSVCLSHSLRCTADTLELARKLLPLEVKVASWTELPGTPASSPSAVNVERHPSHPGSKAGACPSFVCRSCDGWLRESLSLLEGDLSLDAEHWKHWVVLFTGDWGSDSQLTEKLVKWLRRQGVPAVHERELDNQVSNLSVSSVWYNGKKAWSSDHTATTRARVEFNKDKDGRPAVHVMRGSLFRGLEKPCVLVVHYDWRDDHPDHQSKEEWKSRQSQHQGQLFHAVTSCRGQLAVLLLSSSPAASLLPHHA